MRIITILILIFTPAVIMAKVIKPYIVFIKENALLRVINEPETTLKVPKGFYAKVLEVDPLKRDLFKVYNEKGISKYLVESYDIVEVNEDYQLYPEEKGDKFYPPQTQFRQANKKLPFESQFVFNLDVVDLSPLNEFLNTDVSSVFSSRYKISTQYISTFPFRAGLNLNYQSTSWKDQNLNSSTLSILSIGPEFKYIIIDRNEFKFSTHFSFEFSPNYSISSALGKDEFSANLWNLGVQNEFDTILGKVTLGADFRKHYLTFKKTNRTTSPFYPIEYGITSFGVNMGLIYYWDL